MLVPTYSQCASPAWTFGHRWDVWCQQGPSTSRWRRGCSSEVFPACPESILILGGGVVGASASKGLRFGGEGVQTGPELGSAAPPERPDAEEAFPALRQSGQPSGTPAAGGCRSLGGTPAWSRDAEACHPGDAENHETGCRAGRRRHRSVRVPQGHDTCHTCASNVRVGRHGAFLSFKHGGAAPKISTVAPHQCHPGVRLVPPDKTWDRAPQDSLGIARAANVVRDMSPN
jgi:hypothetical protein